MRRRESPYQSPDHATVEIDIPSIGVRRWAFPPDDELLEHFISLGESMENASKPADRLRQSAACVGLWWADSETEFEAEMNPADLVGTGRAVLKELWQQGWPSEVVLSVAASLIEEGKGRIISESEVSDRVSFGCRPVGGLTSDGLTLN